MTLRGATVEKIGILGVNAAFNQAMCAILPTPHCPYTIPTLSPDSVS